MVRSIVVFAPDPVSRETGYGTPFNAPPSIGKSPKKYEGAGPKVMTSTVSLDIICRINIYGVL